MERGAAPAAQSVPAAHAHLIKGGSAGNLLFLIPLKKTFSLCFKLDSYLLPPGKSRPDK